jgi:multicomponent Na+:H+ antiporter subunit D
MMISTNLPIIQVILPLLGALVAALLNVRYARFLALIITVMTVAINIYVLMTLDLTQSYAIGGWSPPIGIEYRLDYLSQTTLLCISCILFFVLVFCRQDIITQIEDHITVKYSNIAYTMIMLIHTGFSGMVSTNDLFNLYVFLEIASLASYACLAQGSDKRTIIAALDYLILGTIGATLILLSIAMIFTTTGTLNIDDIFSRIHTLYHNRILILGLCMFIVGCFFKLALFPLHFWMIRAYRFAPPVLLAFLAPISSIVGFYVLLRFIYFVCDYKVLYDYFDLGSIILTFSALAIIINSYLAFKSTCARSIILYSSAAQVGYSCLALSAPSPQMLGVAASFILADVLMKISLFMVASDLKDTTPKLPPNNLFLFLIFIMILSNASMPLTIGFINKINLLSLFFEAGSYIPIAVIIGASVLAIEYNYRLFKIVQKSGGGSVTRLLVMNIGSFVLLLINTKFVQSISYFLQFFLQFHA